MVGIGGIAGATFIGVRNILDAVVEGPPPADGGD